MAQRRPAASRSLIAPTLIVFAGIATYWNSLDGPFLWDDVIAVVSNDTIRDLWPPWAAAWPPPNSPVAGRPLVNLSFALSHAAGGLDPTPYHVGNLLLHIAAGLVLAAVVRRTIERPDVGGTMAPAAPQVALGAALLWMVHPLTSEVLNYVTERSEALMGLCALLTLYCASRASGGANPTRWEWLSVLACACGMAAKETMAVVPLVVVLYDRTFLFSSLKEAWQSRRRLYAGLASTWVLLAAFSLLQPRSNAGFNTDVGVWTYAINQLPLIARYLWLVVWPHALVLDYGVPRAVTVSAVGAPAAVVLAALVLTAMAVARWPKVGFLGAVFFLMLAPASSVVPIASEVGAERRMYVPLMAVVVAFVLLIAWTTRRRAVCAAVLAACVIGLAARTVARNAEYGAPVALWRTTVERWPHGRARLAYGEELLAVKRPQEAVEQLRLAVEDYPRARFNLGNALAQAGQIDQGIEQLRRFISETGDRATALVARDVLGRLLVLTGDLGGAAVEFRAILAIVPSHPDANASLGDVYMLQRRARDAVSPYRKLVQLRPDNLQSSLKLAQALASAGEIDAAIDAFRRVLSLDRQSFAAHRGLADLLMTRRRPAEAADHARKATELDPRDAESHNLLGIALASQGNIPEAVPHFRRAVELQPDHGEARNNLQRAEALVAMARGRQVNSR